MGRRIGSGARPLSEWCSGEPHFQWLEGHDDFAVDVAAALQGDVVADLLDGEGRGDRGDPLGGDAELQRDVDGLGAHQRRGRSRAWTETDEDLDFAQLVVAALDRLRVTVSDLD